MCNEFLSTNWFKLAGVLLFALGWGIAAGSAQDKEAGVKDRQATMKAQSAALVSIKKYLDGHGDLASATASAENLVKLGQSLPDKFPPGTGMDAFPELSNARPTIWTEPDKFIAAQRNLVTKAEQLAATIRSGDKKAVADQYTTTVNNGCGGCHEAFRENRG
jgi:cytochrome c556